MPGQQIRLLKIFIASPSDVKLEREKAREEIISLQPVAQKLGYMLEAIGWETHATPGMGRSQELLNLHVRECDLFIGILWRKFGAPTGEAESGTLEEFNLARERHMKERAPEIMLYFREVHPDFLADPGDQLKKVLNFKQQVEDGRLALYQNYRDPEHFAGLLRQHVTDWLLKLAPVTNDRPMTTNDAPANDAPPLSAFAEHLEYCRTELQKTARPLRLRTLTLPPLFLEEVDAERPRNMKVSNAVKMFPRLLILGEPGAGKTTSLKMLAAEYAVWRGEGKEPGLNEPEDFNLPIFVDLSAYPTLSAGDSKYGLWRLITASVRGVHDVDVRKRFAAGGCLLLLDGLNEVGEAYDEVAHQIRHLINEVPRNRFVVTCRPGVYRDELRNEFVAFQLERLSSFNASKVLEIEIGAEKAQAAWKGLDEYTRDLCRNPLMLTLLADELRVSDTPPQNRAQLFDRFVDRYLSEWARVKGAGAVRVEKEILSALAWRLGTNRTLLSADEAAAAMSARLTQLQNKKEASVDLNVASLNREFLEHGLLRESAGQTGFFHQAVQEYFFAREVALHQSVEYVLKHVGDPEWAEVLVFVCGLVEDATEVVREVMKVDTYLAAKCIAYAKGIDGKIVDELAALFIHEIKKKFDRIWIGKLYCEMLAILSIEVKAHTKPLTDLFCRVYDDSTRALHEFAYIIVWLHISETAIRFIEPLVKQQPSDVRLRGCLAVAYRDARRFEDAVTNFKKCLDSAPEDAWIWGNLGITYKEMRNLEEAEICLRRAIELDKKLIWPHCHLGFTLLRQNNYQTALEKFQHAISHDLDYGLPHLGLAGIYEHLNQPEKAITEYDLTMQLEQRPSFISAATFGLACALEAVSRTTEARQRYQEYLDRDPWGEHAPEALAALERLGEK